ncbi:MAG: LPS export ABC transporter periplasmic protein LptC [Gammaproteobacteria bacterium]|jgi:lipopolysaccharide export system protein LptC|nr:LPS export ABC transporter periplasmic protein LptC [Gammaproteobacteria bacterium]
MSRRELGLLLLLTSVVIAGWWLQRSREGGEAGAHRGERRPDYVVEGIRGLVLDIDGLPDRRLNAQRLRHYPDDGSSELDEPVMIVYPDEGPPWRVRSRSAWINANADEVLLQRDVRVRRAKTPRMDAIELRTSELRVLPQQDYAETDRFVEIERGQDWLTSQQGLRAWLADAIRAEFFGRVHARLEL